MSAPNGMIAAIVQVNGGRVATRNLTDFNTTGLNLISLWDFWGLFSVNCPGRVGEGT